MGVFVVPACIEVYSRALVKPEVPARTFAAANSVSKYDCVFAVPSVMVDP